MADPRVEFKVGANTQYIISTSGRATSMRRYRTLLQDMLHLDVAYLPISSQDGKIAPERFVMPLRGTSM